MTGIVDAIKKKVNFQQPVPEEKAKLFKEGSGRRYMKVGLSMIETFNGIAKETKDKELLEHAKTIEDAVYERNGDMFTVGTRMFQSRCAEIGIWKSGVGLVGYHKTNILNKLKGK
jgi:hypothetical protein